MTVSTVPLLFRSFQGLPRYLGFSNLGFFEIKNRGWELTSFDRTVCVQSCFKGGVSRIFQDFSQISGKAKKPETSSFVSKTFLGIECKS